MVSARPKTAQQQYASDSYAAAAHKAGHKLRDAIDRISDETQNISAAAIKQVRQKPVQSTLIALGIGVVAGLLLLRRRR